MPARSRVVASLRQRLRSPFPTTGHRAIGSNPVLPAASAHNAGSAIRSRPAWCRQLSSSQSRRERAPTPTPAASASSNPDDAAFSDVPEGSDQADEVFWSRRIDQKRRYAHETLNLARYGGPRGPDLMRYIRNRMLLLAEGEILEESWFKAGTTQAWPAASRMAAACYHEVTSTLLQRRERFDCAVLLEDWLRFASWQKILAPQDAVDLSAAEAIIVMVANYAAQEAPESPQSREQWLSALATLCEASQSADLPWTTQMDRRAGIAFFAGGRVAQGAAILSRSLDAWWQRYASRRQRRDHRREELRGASKESPPGQVSLTRTIAMLASEAGGALARSRVALGRVRATTPGHTNKEGRGVPAGGSDNALATYVRCVRTLAVPFEDGRLPLPMSPRQTRSTGTIREAHEQDAYFGLIRELFAQFPESIRLGLLPLRSQDDVSADRKAIRLLLDSAVLRWFHNSAPAAGSSQVPRPRAPNLTERTCDILLLYCLRHYKEKRSGKRRASQKTPRLQLVKAAIATLTQKNSQKGKGTALAEWHLTTLLNEATYQRLPAVENSILKLLLVQAGVRTRPPPQPLSDEVTGPEIIELLRRAAAQRRARQATVLLRHIATSGRLAAKPQTESPGQSEEQVESSLTPSIQSERAVHAFIGRFPRDVNAVAQPDATTGRQLLSRPDAWALQNPRLCAALLNVAVKAGNWPLTDQLWSLISSFARSRQNALIGARVDPTNQSTRSQELPRVISVAEATCYFQSLHARMQDLTGRLFAGLDRDGRLDTSQDTQHSSELERFANLRAFAMEQYDDLLASWEHPSSYGSADVNAACMSPRLAPDRRFFRAALGATGCSQIVETVFEAQTRVDRTNRKGSTRLRRAKGTPLSFFDSAEAVSQPDAGVSLGQNGRHLPPPLLARMQLGLDLLGMTSPPSLQVQDGEEMAASRMARRLSSSSMFLQVIGDMVVGYGIPLPIALRQFLLRYSRKIESEPIVTPQGATADGNGDQSLLGLVLMQSRALAVQERNSWPRDTERHIRPSSRKLPRWLRQRYVKSDLRVKAARHKTLVRSLPLKQRLKQRIKARRREASDSVMARQKDRFEVTADSSKAMFTQSA
ncbi:unnamed protein product [Parajaminaea phylloscopi]